MNLLVYYLSWNIMKNQDFIKFSIFRYSLCWPRLENNIIIIPSLPTVKYSIVIIIFFSTCTISYFATSSVILNYYVVSHRIVTTVYSTWHVCICILNPLLYLHNWNSVPIILELEFKIVTNLEIQSILIKFIYNILVVFNSVILF